MKTRASFDGRKPRLVLTQRGWAVIVLTVLVVVMAFAVWALTLTPPVPGVG